MIRVDVSEFRMLAQKIRDMPVEGQAELEAGVAESGEIIVEALRNRTSWSANIGDSFNLEPAGLEVRVSTDLTEAVALENQGHGHVRHPLYGTREHWYNNPQPAFMGPALNDAMPAIRERVINAFQSAWRTVSV